jgi:hypothetical protein
MDATDNPVLKQRLSLVEGRNLLREEKKEYLVEEKKEPLSLVAPEMVLFAIKTETFMTTKIIYYYITRINYHNLG